MSSFNPLRLLNETRTWIDANQDAIPQLNEIGPTRGGLTSAATVRIDPELRRPYQWEQSVTLEHQLQQTLAVALSYYHRKFPIGYASMNVAVGPSDYVPVTIANPLDGTPFVVYNQTAASATRVDNVVTNTSDLNSWYHAVQLAFNKRMSSSFQLSGGFTIGADKTCTGASTNPNSQVNSCGYTASDSKFMGNLNVVYRLPAGGQFLQSHPADDGSATGHHLYGDARGYSEPDAGQSVGELAADRRAPQGGVDAGRHSPQQDVPCRRALDRAHGRALQRPQRKCRAFPRHHGWAHVRTGFKQRRMERIAKFGVKIQF